MPVLRSSECSDARTEVLGDASLFRMLGPDRHYGSEDFSGATDLKPSDRRLLKDNLDRS